MSIEARNVLSKAPKKPKRKHNWMAGFVLGNRTSDADQVKYESLARMRDYQNKMIKYGK